MAGRSRKSPLNGRYFLDLAFWLPGRLRRSQSGFSTTPSRGLGALAINTAGNREETVNYMVNGITLNDLVFSSIVFQPSISTVQEFKIDNSTFSAEYGQSSGAVVNVATRSGTSQFHGELFEFLRNDALDARNFFNFTSSEPPPFKRNQFGGNLGGPDHPGQDVLLLLLRRTSPGAGTESQQRGSERCGARRPSTDAVVAKLVELMPRPNFVDSAGNAAFHRLGARARQQRSMGPGHQSHPEPRMTGCMATTASTTRRP